MAPSKPTGPTPAPPTPAEPVATPPGQARRRRKEARPAELLDAALALFVQKGFAATRTDDVAARAGVSKGTLYLYYPSKEDLLKAVIREHVQLHMDDALARIRQVLDSGQALAPLLQQVLVAWWTRTYEGPASGVFKIIVTEVGSFPDLAEFWLQEVVRPARQWMGSLIEAGIARGEFIEQPSQEVVHSLMLPMVMLCIHKHSLGCAGLNLSDIDPPRFIVRHIDTVLRGIATRPGPGPQHPGDSSS